MNEKNIEELLTEVSQESEARRHDPLFDDAVGVRRDDRPAPRVLSVRLTAALREVIRPELLRAG